MDVTQWGVELTSRRTGEHEVTMWSDSEREAGDYAREADRLAQREALQTVKGR